jgi:hypothetical protein
MLELEELAGVGVDDPNVLRAGIDAKAKRTL